MEENNGNEFTKQFIGSASANVVFCVGFLIYKFIEGHCKHSRCQSNLKWFKCNADNYDTERAENGDTNQIVNAVRSEKGMSEMQTPEHQIIPSQHIKTLELRSPRSLSRDSQRRRVVTKESLVWEVQKASTWETSCAIDSSCEGGARVWAEGK